jgi:2,3-bisphosphoglycerate-dependent phosphoglycerate mutase
MTQLLIARHANTFDPGETPRRVGARTDLPLSHSGRQQAQQLGEYIKIQHPDIQKVYVSALQRTQQTAQLALAAANLSLPVEVCAWLNEIDYGPDENCTEAEVIARVGQPALTAWNTHATVPTGWQVDPAQVSKAWQHFAENIIQQYPNQKVWVVTSNGIARFAFYLLANAATHMAQQSIKLSTAAVGCFAFNGTQWHLDFWNQPANGM